MTLSPPDTRVYNNHVLFLLILWVKSLSRTWLCSAGHSAAHAWPFSTAHMDSLSHGVSFLVVQPQLPYSWVARFPSREEAESLPQGQFCHSQWLEQLQSLPRSRWGQDWAETRPIRDRSGALAREETGAVAVFEESYKGLTPPLALPGASSQIHWKLCLRLSFWGPQPQGAQSCVVVF